VREFLDRIKVLPGKRTVLVVFEGGFCVFFDTFCLRYPFYIADFCNNRGRNQPEKNNIVESSISRNPFRKRSSIIIDQLAQLAKSTKLTARNPNPQDISHIKELVQAKPFSAKAHHSKSFEKALDKFEEKHTVSSHKGKGRAEGVPVFDNEVISSVQKGTPAPAAQTPAEDNLSEDELAGPSTKAKGKQPVRRQIQPKSKKMSFQGIDLTAEAGQINSISWQ